MAVVLTRSSSLSFESYGRLQNSGVQAPYCFILKVCIRYVCISMYVYSKLSNLHELLYLNLYYLISLSSNVLRPPPPTNNNKPTYSSNLESPV